MTALLTPRARVACASCLRFNSSLCYWSSFFSTLYIPPPLVLSNLACYRMELCIAQAGSVYGSHRSTQVLSWTSIRDLESERCPKHLVRGSDCASRAQFGRGHALGMGTGAVNVACVSGLQCQSEVPLGNYSKEMDETDEASEGGNFSEDEAESRSTSKMKGKLEGGLYLVATPIGNLEDMTFRALRVLKEAKMILAEDTRHSAKLLHYYDIGTPMMSYHKFNETARQDAIIQRLKCGEILALISDAGMPGISDPGFELVRACVEASVQVYPIPGASAAITALVASGLPTNEFSFIGFLPTHAGTRQKRLSIASKQTATQILYVPPHKLARILGDCMVAFGATRRCVVAREMTKLHEEFWRGTLEQAYKEFQEKNPRGEMTLVIEGLSLSACLQLPSDEEIEARLQILMDAGISPSTAIKQVVEETGVRRKVVYSLALKLSGVKTAAEGT